MDDRIEGIGRKASCNPKCCPLTSYRADLPAPASAAVLDAPQEVHQLVIHLIMAYPKEQVSLERHGRHGDFASSRFRHALDGFFRSNVVSRCWPAACNQLK